MSAVERHSAMRGQMLENEPMSRHSSWRAGGPARRFYRPADRADLLAFLQQLPPAEPVLFVGLGSNLLIRDGGFTGTVIHLLGALDQLRMEDKSEGDAAVAVYAEAGVSCAQLARFAARERLAGGAFFAGIPGTVGGALAMNAGAFGSETWEFVREVETVDRRGRVRVRAPDDFQIAYRRVTGPPEEWFVGARFRFVSDPEAADAQRIKELLNQRAATQPIGLHSCGSVFRNPPGDHAARLIESCGLKGTRVGGAHVSDKHANFIINDARAGAGDIEALIMYVQQQVAERTGVTLEPEVVIAGEAAE